MKKYLLCCMTAMLSVTLFSCSSDDDQIKFGEDGIGTYQVIVTQEANIGKLEDYEIGATVIGVAGKGIFNSATEENVGLYYNLKEEEAYAPVWAYETGNDGQYIGVVIVYATSFEMDQNNQEGEIHVKISISFNGKEVSKHEETVHMKKGDLPYTINFRSLDN